MSDPETGGTDASDADAAGWPVGPAAAAPPTGVAIVDEVLAGLEGIEVRPVGERVAEFERAHEGLRRALDDEPPADAGA